MKSGRDLNLAVALVTVVVWWGSAAAPGLLAHSEDVQLRGPAGLPGAANAPNLPGRRLTLAPNLQIRDSKGRFVGLVINLYPEGAQVARRNGDDLLIFRVQKTGISDSSEVPFVYESGDCSGPALMIDQFQVGDAALAIELPFKLGTTGYYPVPPYTTRTLSSILTFPVSDPACASAGGIFHPPDQCCHRVDGFSYSAGEVRTVDFSSLEAPFHVQGP